MPRTRKLPPVKYLEESTSSSDIENAEKVQRLPKKQKIEDKPKGDLISSDEEDEKIVAAPLRKYRVKDPVRQLKMFARERNLQCNLFRNPGKSSDVVIVASLRALGSGNNMEQAKKNACKNFLDLLTGVKKDEKK